jgi:hypothetical protein
MKLELEPKDENRYLTLGQLFPKANFKYIHGHRVEFVQIRPDHTEKQRSGFHWLLSKWLELNPKAANNFDQLKTHVLKLHFGVFKITDAHGNEMLLAVKRTTKEWNWNKARYVRAQLTIDQYQELIRFTYQLAAEHGTELPELDPEHKKALAA